MVGPEGEQVENRKKEAQVSQGRTGGSEEAAHCHAMPLQLSRERDKSTSVAKQNQSQQQTH